MSGAREEILARVRQALADVPEHEPGRDEAADVYRLESGLPAAGAVARFAERVSEYRANVRVVGSDEIAAAVTQALASHAARLVAVPADLPRGWRPAGADLVEDSPALAPADLDAVDAALTGCALAIADTGTIVLDAGAGQGRRALTLIPDLHVCVVDADRVVGSVPEAIRALEQGALNEPRPLTFISGPSATSDIELSRVEGVHGPRRLEVVVVN